MFVLSIFLPLISYTVCVFLNKLVKEATLNFISCALMVSSTICSIVSLIFFHLDGDKSFVITNWISSGSLNIDWSFNSNLLILVLSLLYDDCIGRSTAHPKLFYHSTARVSLIQSPATSTDTVVIIFRCFRSFVCYSTFTRSWIIVFFVLRWVRDGFAVASPRCQPLRS